MKAAASARNTLTALLITAAVFVALRFVGASLLANNWSFNHWKLLPVWYPGAWFAAVAVLAGLLLYLVPRAAGRLTCRPAVIALALALMAGLALFRMDSYILTAGNLRIQQIAQAPQIVFRWYEFGTVLVVAGLDWLLRLFHLHDSAYTAGNIAAVWSWRAFAFIGTGLSLVGSILLARDLTRDPVKRVIVFLLIFFGPQTLVHFGHTGFEPALAAAVVWFAWAALRAIERNSTARLATMWLVVTLSLVVHATAAILVPAAVLVTAARGRRKDAGRSVVVAGLAAYLILLAGAYALGHWNLELAKYLLVWPGKAPFADYGLLSLRHVTDVIQLFLLLAPAVVVVKLALWQRLEDVVSQPRLMLVLLLALTGNTAVFVLDPVNSIVLDLPRFAAFMTPLGILAAVLVAEMDLKAALATRTALLLAVFTLAVPLCYLPTHLRIDHIAAHATPYFDRHDWFHMDGDVAFRDAYFYRGDLDQANAWEQGLPVRSPDHLALRSANDLVAAGRYNDAVRLLQQLKLRNRYWVEPRLLLAAFQLHLGRPQLAKPEIDTCLMLAPHRPESHVNLYGYYRETGDYQRALEGATRADAMFPGSPEIVRDLMILRFASQDYAAADSLASVLLDLDPEFPQPYLVKGLKAETLGNAADAIDNYERFLRLAPESQEAVDIRRRIDSLRALSR